MNRKKQKRYDDLDWGERLVLVVDKKKGWKEKILRGITLFLNHG